MIRASATLGGEHVVFAIISPENWRRVRRGQPLDVRRSGGDGETLWEGGPDRVIVIMGGESEADLGRFAERMGRDGVRALLELLP